MPLAWHGSSIHAPATRQPYKAPRTLAGRFPRDGACSERAPAGRGLMGTRMPRWLKSTWGRGLRRQPKPPGVRGRSALVVVSFVDFRGPQWWHGHGRKYRSCHHHGLVVCWRGYGWSLAAREAVCKRLCILAIVFVQSVCVYVYMGFCLVYGYGRGRLEYIQPPRRRRPTTHGRTVKGQICIHNISKTKKPKDRQHMDMAYISILTPTSSSTLTMRITTHSAIQQITQETRKGAAALPLYPLVASRLVD